MIPQLEGQLLSQQLAINENKNSNRTNHSYRWTLNAFSNFSMKWYSNYYSSFGQRYMIICLVRLWSAVPGLLSSGYKLDLTSSGISQMFFHTVYNTVKQHMRLSLGIWSTAIYQHCIAETNLITMTNKFGCWEKERANNEFLGQDWLNKVQESKKFMTPFVKIYEQSAGKL